MKRILSLSLAFSFIFVSAYARGAQRQAEADEPGGDVPDQQSVDPGITQTRVLGEVAEIDAVGKRVIVKTEAILDPSLNVAAFSQSVVAPRRLTDPSLRLDYQTRHGQIPRFGAAYVQQSELQLSQIRTTL